MRLEPAPASHEGHLSNEDPRPGAVVGGLATGRPIGAVAGAIAGGFTGELIGRVAGVDDQCYYRADNGDIYKDTCPQT